MTGMAFTLLTTESAGPEELLDTSEVAQRLGMNRTAVTTLIKERRLPAVRLGQRWIIRRCDVEAWERANPGDGRRGAHRVACNRAQITALALIIEHPGITVADVAERTGEIRRTALGRLQFLEHEGLIRREPGASQLHCYRCYPTEAGLERYRTQLATAESA